MISENSMDNISNFQYIWKEWLIPLAQKLYSQMDENFKKECNVKINNFDDIYPYAESFYQRKRKQLKRDFYGEYKIGDAEYNSMDFHKIGAIICQTLIEYKVFSFDAKKCKKYIEKNINQNNTDWVVRNALINFRFAFYSSVVFLFHAMRYECHENNTKLFNALNKKGKLNLYEINVFDGINNLLKEGEVKESFENCVVLDLAKRFLQGHSFDCLMYAVILYQLEIYNKIILQIEFD